AGLGLSHPSHSFFVSSRRRNTRFSRDWSSDVCSSDLLPHGCIPAPSTATSLSICSLRSLRAAVLCGRFPRHVLAPSSLRAFLSQIGRASWREGELTQEGAAAIHYTKARRPTRMTRREA